MEKTVAFLTLGCKVNQYETDAMRELFVKSDYEVRDFAQNASVYVINTCTVTNMADHKSRQMLHRAKRKNPDSIVVAVGCYVQEAAKKLEEDSMIDIVIGNNMKSQIVQIVEDYMADDEPLGISNCLDIAHVSEYESMSISTVTEHTRAYIKIQDGCNQFCSYCIIPYARGRIRSRSSEDIVTEVRRLADSGCQEIVFTGIHISSYGLDFEHRVGSKQEDYGPFKNSRLLELIEEIACIDGISRIRLGSLEPRIITESFVKRLAAIDKVCPHFHLSLQSGCDDTLKRMNRHYTTELYREKCDLLRRYFDRPAITTDVIVGFPGETQKEFDITKEFLESIGFADMHIFKYSRRKGTLAAIMPDQIHPQIQSLRSDILLELAKNMHDDYIEALANQEQLVLLEEEALIDGKRYMTGYSRNYVRCAFAASGLQPNQIVSGCMRGKLNENFVFCEIIH